MVPIQMRLSAHLRKLNSEDYELDALFNEVFSTIQNEIPFHAGWFFPINPDTLQPIKFSKKIWKGVAPPEMNGTHSAPSLFPSIRQLLQRGSLCTRGEEWWTHSQLADHPIYQKTLKPNRLYFALILLFLDNEKKCRGYSVFWRERLKGAFANKDLETLTVVAPIVGSYLKKNPVQQASISEVTSDITEEELHVLVRRRAQPGILILSQHGQILYVNHDAKNLLEGLTLKTPPLPQHQSLPEIIYQLFIQFKEIVGENGQESAIPTANRVCIHEGVVFLFRALLLQKQGANRDTMHIMILIEKVSQGVRIDQFVQSTHLTKREQAVVRLLLEGKTNKEVASCMNIGEYTVKDHVKRIMKKLNVTTRAGIVAKVLHQQLPAS